MVAKRLSQEEILEQFSELVAESLRVERTKVKPDSYLDHDFGVESLDLIEITMETESRFNVWMPEKSILDTATEIFGPDVLVKDGVLTPAGKHLLARRLPPEHAGMFAGEVSVDELQKYFLQVQTWARLIYTLLQYTPESCDICGGSLKSTTGFRMKCSNCGKQNELRSGEDLNRDWVRQYYEKEYLPSLTPESERGVGPDANPSTSGSFS
jgi:acyl carrier protein